MNREDVVPWSIAPTNLCPFLAREEVEKDAEWAVKGDEAETEDRGVPKGERPVRECEAKEEKTCLVDAEGGLPEIEIDGAGDAVEGEEIDTLSDAFCGKSRGVFG